MRPVKQKKLWLGVFLFAALCAATMAFLGLFTRADGEMYYLSWQSAAVLDGDGGAEALEPDEYGGYSQTGDGRRYRLTARAEDLPEEGYLVLETAGLELAVLFNGEELYASRSDYPYSRNAPNAQAHIPLPLGAEGGALEVEFRVLDPEIALFPPLARVTTDAAVQLAAALGWQGFDWLIPPFCCSIWSCAGRTGPSACWERSLWGRRRPCWRPCCSPLGRPGGCSAISRPCPWSCPSGISTGSSISSPSIWFWPARGSRPISWPGRSPGPGPRPGPCASAAS